MYDYTSSETPGEFCADMSMYFLAIASIAFILAMIITKFSICFAVLFCTFFISSMVFTVVALFQSVKWQLNIKDPLIWNLSKLPFTRLVFRENILHLEVLKPGIVWYQPPIFLRADKWIMTAELTHDHNDLYRAKEYGTHGHFCTYNNQSVPAFLRIGDWMLPTKRLASFANLKETVGVNEVFWNGWIFCADTRVHKDSVLQAA